MNNCPIVHNTDENKCAISNNCPTVLHAVSELKVAPGFRWGRWSRSRRRRCLPWTGTSSRSSRSRTHRPPRSPQSASSWRAPHLHTDRSSIINPSENQQTHALQLHQGPTCMIDTNKNGHRQHVQCPYINISSRMHLYMDVSYQSMQEQSIISLSVFPFCFFPLPIS